MRIPVLSIIAVLYVVAASACTSREFFATSDQNPPWFPSLMAFEHYDSERTHLFAGPIRRIRERLIRVIGLISEDFPAGVNETCDPRNTTTQLINQTNQSITVRF